MRKYSTPSLICVAVNADAWKEAELRSVVAEGARLLNIEFDTTFVNQLINGCSSNVYIVQEACHRACCINGIEETQDDKVTIGEGMDVRKLIQEIVREQSGRYNAFISNYANGFQETALEMHKWVLYPVLTSTSEELMRGLSYRTIRTSLERKHPKGKGLNPGNVTQALKSVVSLQLAKSIQPIILDYDESNLNLHVVDRGFIIWLDVQDKIELLTLAELPAD